MFDGIGIGESNATAAHFPSLLWNPTCHLTTGPHPTPSTHPLHPSHRYEEEINRRTVAENEFVVLKKVSQKVLPPDSGPRRPLLGVTIVT